MILLDTNIIIEFFKQNSTVVAELHRLELSNLAVSVVVAAELYQGALNTAELKLIEKGVARFRHLPLLPEIGEQILDLLRQYALSHRLQFPDALIAATSLHHQIPLYTLNKKDFRYIAGLQLHEPA
ncbi:type II toxin-antitoxin system VapC family toxin [Hymenobacter artigasi]|uniref:Ribonuclease VapC n=1 Tax=Hymenobacter artigasi TaxID=2719616 RepID=A0ABX1HK73_9BACT|nr:type II toxin-antitoxin system VapC family toxin [Hymenobacter artigasi]NKI90654.1 putative nucleic acid-binding protein [Hymenobacter artigasi]